MKSILLLSLAAGILAVSCNNNKKPGDVTVTSDDGKTTTTVNTSELAQTADKMQEKAEALKKLTPYTSEEIKAMFPESIGDAKRTSYSANSAMGAVMAEAKYKISDTADYEISIIDCAGEAGSAMYGLQYIGLMRMESETETEYTKTVDYNGAKAIETVNKENKDATLVWFAKDRLMVTVKGDHTGLDAVKQVASSLSLK